LSSDEVISDLVGYRFTSPVHNYPYLDLLCVYAGLRIVLIERGVCKISTSLHECFSLLYFDLVSGGLSFLHDKNTLVKDASINSMHKYFVLNSFVMNIVIKECAIYEKYGGMLLDNGLF